MGQPIPEDMTGRWWVARGTLSWARRYAYTAATRKGTSPRNAMAGSCAPRGQTFQRPGQHPVTILTQMGAVVPVPPRRRTPARQCQPLDPDRSQPPAADWPHRPPSRHPATDPRETPEPHSPTTRSSFPTPVFLISRNIPETMPARPTCGPPLPALDLQGNDGNRKRYSYLFPLPSLPRRAGGDRPRVLGSGSGLTS